LSPRLRSSALSMLISAKELEASEADPECHTKESRMKRGGIKERRDAINGQLNALADEMRQGQEAISRLRATAENNLALAKFAEGWKLKEVEAIAKT
jgi:hypothetical protein